MVTTVLEEFQAEELMDKISDTLKIWIHFLRMWIDQKVKSITGTVLHSSLFIYIRSPVS